MGAAALGALTSRANGAAPREVGAGRRPYGERSSFESSVRTVNPSATPGTGSSRTPLQDLCGIITPSSLHFERHHRSEEHTSELQSRVDLVCRLLLEKKKN